MDIVIPAENGRQMEDGGPDDIHSLSAITYSIDFLPFSIDFYDHRPRTDVYIARPGRYIRRQVHHLILEAFQ